MVRVAVYRFGMKQGATLPMIASVTTRDTLPGVRLPAQAAPPWEMAMCRRSGAPPVRFVGRLLASQTVAATTDDAMQIDLWQRRAGGYSVAFRLPDADGWRSRLITAQDIAALIDAMEATCRDVLRPGAAARDQGDRDLDETGDAWLREARLREDRRRFADAVGVALDRWMSIEDARRPTDERARHGA